MTVTKKSVLIVEDSPDGRALMVSLLQRHGYAVAVAGDGSEALDYLRGGGMPDVILLDLRMPGMDGFQFLEVQGQEPTFADIPVVVYSAEHIPVVRAPNVVSCLQKASGCKAVLDAIGRAVVMS